MTTFILQGNEATDLRGGGSFNSTFHRSFLNLTVKNYEDLSTIAEVIIKIKAVHLLQTNLSAQLVSVHSLSSTSLSIVLILTKLATNISLLPLWRNYSELQTYITSLILQKKLIFTASYDVYKHFIVVI